MPRESISTPSGASCRRPIPTSRHKKGNPFTPMCLVCRYAWFAVVFAAIPLLCRSFLAAAFFAAILSLSQCCRAAISPAAAFMRLHFGAPRRASLLRRVFLGCRFFRSNPCPVAVLPRGDFSRRRFYADAHRRPAAGIASLLPSRSRRWAGTRLAGVPALLVAGTPARAPGALVAEYPQHRAVGLLLGEEPRIVFVVALVAVDDDVLRCRDQAVLDAAETAQ